VDQPVIPNMFGNPEIISVYCLVCFSCKCPRPHGSLTARLFAAWCWTCAGFRRGQCKTKGSGKLCQRSVM